MKGQNVGVAVEVFRLSRSVTCAAKACGTKLSPGTLVLRFNGRGFDGFVRCEQHQAEEELRFLRKGSPVRL